MSKTSLGVGGPMTASDWRQTTITRQLEILVTTLATKQGSTGQYHFLLFEFFPKGFLDETSTRFKRYARLACLEIR